MVYWQIGAGYGGESGGGRSYPDVFLDFGVMLIGPGEYGEYDTNSRDYKQKKDGRRVERFVEEIECGHKVALKRPAGRGRWEVVAVGEVEGDYEWMPVFDDVEGWDIRHGRRVKWRIPVDGPRTTRGLTRGTLWQVQDAEAKEVIDGIWESGERVEPSALPSPPQALDRETLKHNLLAYGVGGQEGERVVQAMQEIGALGQWYRDRVREGIKVKEHETRTLLIVPLLLAFGWPAKKLKIEWHNIDIAFFENDYREDNTKCVMILESKKLLESLATKAKDQVTRYSRLCPSCETLIVSDGCSYKKLERIADDTWTETAYLNVLKPRVSHPYRNDIDGASQVIASLMSR